MRVFVSSERQQLHTDALLPSSTPPLLPPSLPPSPLSLPPSLPPSLTHSLSTHSPEAWSKWLEPAGN